MVDAVDVQSMTRPRTETSNNREPTPPAKLDEEIAETQEDDSRVVLSSWDAPLVPDRR